MDDNSIILADNRDVFHSLSSHHTLVISFIYHSYSEMTFNNTQVYISFFTYKNNFISYAGQTHAKAYNGILQI